MTKSNRTKSRDYQKAKKRAFALMRKGLEFDFTPPKSRDELYERGKPRKDSG